MTSARLVHSLSAEEAAKAHPVHLRVPLRTTIRT